MMAFRRCPAMLASRRLALVCLWLAMLTMAQPGLSQESAPARPEPQMTDYDIQMTWIRHWNYYARACAPLDDDYVALPLFDARYPSSRGTSVEQALAQQLERMEQVAPGVYNRYRRVLGTISRGEAEAATLILPSIAVGHYGYIHSGKVKEVLGPDQMLLEEIWLVNEQAIEVQKDADWGNLQKISGRERNTGGLRALLDFLYTRRDALIKLQGSREARRYNLLLKGFNASRVQPGIRWRGERPDRGVEIALVDVRRLDPDDKNDENQRRGSSLIRRRRQGNLTLVAIPVSSIGLSEEQFLDMLSKRGLDKASFAALIKETMREHTDDTPRLIFQRLAKPVPADVAQDMNETDADE